MTCAVDRLRRQGLLTDRQAWMAAQLAAAPHERPLPPALAGILRDALTEGGTSEDLARRWGVPTRAGLALIRLALDAAWDIHEGDDIEAVADAPLVDAPVSEAEADEWLSDDDGVGDWVRRHGLTPLEARLCEALRRAPGRFLSRDGAARAVYAERDPPACAPRVVAAYRCRAAAKLAGSGWRIEPCEAGWRLAGAPVQGGGGQSAGTLPACDWRAIGLEPFPARLCEALRLAPGGALSYEGLIRRLWLSPDDVPEAAVRQLHVARCRAARALAASPWSIRTVRGWGYVLEAAPVACAAE